MSVDLNSKQIKGGKKAMRLTDEYLEQISREAEVEMAKMEDARRAYSKQFQVVLWNDATVFYNPTCAPFFVERKHYTDIPEKDYAGVVIIEMKGNYRPPMVLMVSDKSISDLILAVEDESQTELIVSDEGGMVINVLKKVIDHIEIPYGKDGLKAVEVRNHIDPEYSDEPQLVPIFKIGHYMDGIAVEITSEGVKRTPMKFKSWKDRIRRGNRRLLQGRQDLDS